VVGIKFMPVFPESKIEEKKTGRAYLP